MRKLPIINVWKYPVGFFLLPIYEYDAAGPFARFPALVNLNTNLLQKFILRLIDQS